jgi:hypothetical protein
VQGQYSARRWDGERFDPQQVKLKCARCGETAETVCDSGRVREKIAKWSVLHVRC